MSGYDSEGRACTGSQAQRESDNIDVAMVGDKSTIKLATQTKDMMAAVVVFTILDRSGKT